MIPVIISFIAGALSTILLLALLESGRENDLSDYDYARRDSSRISRY